MTSFPNSTPPKNRKLACAAVFSNIAACRFPGVPFDEERGTIANDRGRVSADGGPCVGEYAVGWIKRGPSGVIGTNKKDAQETVDLVLEDIESGRVGEMLETAASEKGEG